MNPKCIRTVRKVERPRPLKVNVDIAGKSQAVGEATKPIAEVLNDLQVLYISLSNCNYDENSAAEISKICNILKTRGPELEQINKSLIDHYFVTFRNASREDRLDMVSRLKLLEVIELKAMKWQTNENITSYYKKKITELEGSEKPTALLSPSIAQSYSSLLPNQPTQVPATTISIPLAPGEILRSSGKFSKPTKIAGKNIFKDEVVIRNSDSGKVNPGARDRLVQITGPNEEAISHAKTLVEDTIRRNASPMREKIDNAESSECGRMMCSLGFDEAQEFSTKKQLSHSLSMGDATLGEYSYKVRIGSETITLSGSNAELLKISKIALQAYFAGQAEMEEKEQLHHQISPENQNFSNLNDEIEKIKLQRSSSWMSSTSLSPFDSSSEEETVKDHAAFNRLSNTSDNPSSHKSHLSGVSRSTSFTSDFSPMGSSDQAIVTADNNIYFPEMQRSLSLSSGPLEPEAEPAILPPEPLPRLTYSKQELMKFSKSPLCRSSVPKLCPEVVETFPFILKNSAYREDETEDTDSYPTKS